jgi:cytoskeletal protein RodZ
MTISPNLTLGEILKNSRQSLGYSLKEVSNMLKIKERDLLALENNDADFIAKHFYITALIKSYGQLLNIDKALLGKKIQELNINNHHETKYRLLNISKKNIHSPNKSAFINALLIFATFYLLMFLLRQYQLENLIDIDTIMGEFNKIN